jgi:hypothetical protein
MKTIETTWHPENRLLITRLQGKVDSADVARWKDSLDVALARIENNTGFKILVDMRHYEYASLDAHKTMRVIIPLTLAQYGFRTGLLDLVEAGELALHHTRGISCSAVAHVHHDEEKMSLYQSRVGAVNEGFFNDAGQAESWIRGLTLQTEY